MIIKVLIFDSVYSRVTQFNHFSVHFPLLHSLQMNLVPQTCLCL